MIERRDKIDREQKQSGYAGASGATGQDLILRAQMDQAPRINVPLGVSSLSLLRKKCRWNDVLPGCTTYPGPLKAKNDNRPEVHWQRIDTGQDEDMRVYGFEKNKKKTILTYVSFIITVGFVRLLFHWYPQLYLYATHDRCPLSRATKLLITDNYQGKHKRYFVKDVKRICTQNRGKETPFAKSKAEWEFARDKQKLEKLRINLENGTQCDVFDYKAFWCKKQCYVWDVTQCVFSRLVGLDKYTLCADLHLENNKPLSKHEQYIRRIVYGNNEIIVPIQGILVLLLLEVLNPFYIFQVFTLAVWMSEGYYYYTAAIICMSFYGITTSILQTRKNQVNLSATVAITETVRVLRESGHYENIPSSELVPGDIIELPKYQATVMCDAVLLTGQCILNESMLTGESVPVTKTPLPSRHVLYDPKECAHHTIYSGTTIIQTRYYGNNPVLARVIRTGYQTNRGALVAAILYPPPADFKFDQDSYKFIGILSCIATCGFIYTIVTKASRGITASDIAVKALDIITIVVPPALPAAMTVGKLYAQARLRKAQIYCINNRVINVSGSVNCVCFDKTGTLTEDGLDMWGVVPCANGSLHNSERQVPRISAHPLFQAMLVCHSLTLIDNELCGDPLDVKMFESTGWTFEEQDITSDKYDFVTPTVVKPPKNAYAENANRISEIGIIQQYQFSSSLQRMSVIARVCGSNHFVGYTKGSPEVILSLSRSETIPPDIMFCVKCYTEQGYRVIAMGRSVITEEPSKITRLPRDAVERNLEFLGLVVLENRLKPPTIPIIRELRDASMHVVMITGDNIQTAVSVAKDCGILSPHETVIDVTVIAEENKPQPGIFFSVQEMSPKKDLQTTGLQVSDLGNLEKNVGSLNYRFALTGYTWLLLRQYYPELVPKICVRGAIFARMTSDQKQQLVLELMQLGYYVVMCGDGANDCGALRAAHVGVSLSEAESSVASPFTSKVPDITCVSKVIQEGRAALVTSFGIFKFMVTYSLAQFLSVIILYSIDSNLTDLQFLFIDIFLIINFASFFGKTKAYQKQLVAKPPMTSLLSFSPILSVTLQVLLMTTFQTIAYHAVRYFSWFTPFVPTSNTNYTSYENYSVFCISVFQYITMAVVYSRGKPYRQPIYTNHVFLCSIFLMVVICAYITVYPANWILNVLQMILPEAYDWRLIILALALLNFVLCLATEMFLMEYLFEMKLKRRFYNFEKSKKQYLRVEYELRNDFSWPRINRTTAALSFAPNAENNVKADCNGDSWEIGFRRTELSNSSIRTHGVKNPGFIDDEHTDGKNMITKL